MSIIAPKTNKYGATKTVVDGITFDSYLESTHYKQLKRLKEEGKILDFRMQEVIVLQDKFKRRGKTVRAITMKPDFTVVMPCGTEIYLESKGQALSEFLIKKKLMEFKYPDILYVLAFKKDTPYLYQMLLDELTFKKEVDDE